MYIWVDKGGLKLNIQKTKIMASSPIISWQIDGETVETVTNFIFFGSRITADGDCSHEIKRGLPLGRKVMTNLDSILKSRDITLPTKVRLVKAMIFPVVMYGCESWTIKKAEHQKNWHFWTVVLEKTLESPLDCKEIQPVHPKGNQPWIFTERTDAEAETPILWPPDVKNWLIGKDPDAGKDWRLKEKGTTDGWMASLTQWTWVWVVFWSWWWAGKPRVRHDWVTELNWTECVCHGLLLFCAYVCVGYVVGMWVFVCMSVFVSLSLCMSCV